MGILGGRAHIAVRLVSVLGLRVSLVVSGGIRLLEAAAFRCENIQQIAKSLGRDLQRCVVVSAQEAKAEAFGFAEVTQE
jgi:hypothetical protein